MDPEAGLYASDPRRTTQRRPKLIGTDTPAPICLRSGRPAVAVWTWTSNVSPFSHHSGRAA